MLFNNPPHVCIYPLRQKSWIKFSLLILHHDVIHCAALTASNMQAEAWKLFTDKKKREILQHRAHRAPTSWNHREILDYVETEHTEPSYIKRSVKTCILNFFCSLSEVKWWKTFHGIIILILSFAQQCFAHILMRLLLFMSVWFEKYILLGFSLNCFVQWNMFSFRCTCKLLCLKKWLQWNKQMISEFLRVLKNPACSEINSNFWTEVVM